MRICSLLPSATEIAYALGLGDSVVGVTHECDYPLDAAGRMPTEAKPALLRPRIDPHAVPGEIDRAVREIIERGESIYAVDAELLASLRPDLILTQDLCHVCAASPDDLAAALTRFERPPRVLSLTPRSLADVWDDIRRVGEATSTSREAEALAASLETQVAAIAARATLARTRPRVLCLEWLDPFYVGGHWIPEMVALAGGEDVLGRVREPSFCVTAEQVTQSRPDVVVVMPCGYGLQRVVDEVRADMDKLRAAVGLDGSAVADSCIFAVDANAYFSRPGPRLADGVAILARMLHPEIFADDEVPRGAFAAIRKSETLASGAAGTT